jgi:hypothetical protein
MLDIRTPLSKDTRVSRKIYEFGTLAFVGNSGIWVGVNADGTVYNVTSTTPAVCKILISSASSNTYESNDVKVGRVTTLETTGCRFGVDSDGYATTIGSAGTGAIPGAYLSVANSTSTGNAGKLKVATSGETVVAVCEGFDTAAKVLTFTTCSPVLLA